MQPIAKLNRTPHWTTGSTLSVVRWISSDFVAQLETRMEQFDGWNHTELAKRLNVTLSRVSQVMNSPGNLTLKNTVQYAGALGMKVAVLAYDDNDPERTKGPISADVFRACWEKSGCPRNMFEVDAAVTTSPSVRMWGTAPVDVGSGMIRYVNVKSQNDQWKRLSTYTDLMSSMTTQ